MVIMTLCPNCRTIQKAGNPCPLCKCPIHRRPQDDEPDNERARKEPREVETAAA